MAAVSSLPPMTISEPLSVSSPIPNNVPEKFRLFASPIASVPPPQAPPKSNDPNSNATDIHDSSLGTHPTTDSLAVSSPLPAPGQRAPNRAVTPSAAPFSGPSPSKAARPGSLLAFAAAAIDRTQSALASADFKIHPRQSSGRLPLAPDAASRNSIASSGASTTAASSLAPTALPVAPTDKAETFVPSTASTTSLATIATRKSPRPTSLSQPYTQPYEQTNPNQPLPIRLPRLNNKMHQTSSRLLRMTDNDRPFTRDFQDLFATLVVSLLPLSPHRVRLSKVEHTFLSEDAINNLGSLKFSQSNRMPDPKDPSRIVTTTTTTTFSMARDMARSICQRFLDARLIESADGKYQQVYTMKGSVWQLTPKGIAILDRFCARNGIQQRQVAKLIGHTTLQLVILERDSQTDKVVSDRGTIDVIFRRFIGMNGLNIKASVSVADADSLSDYRDGLTGVRMASERRVGGKTFKDTFTGKAASDWLMDCCTTVDRREAADIAAFFVEYGLVEMVQIDRGYIGQVPHAQLFQPTKQALYQLAAKGRDLLHGAVPQDRSSESDGGPPTRPNLTRDSNTQRLDKILNDAALRLLFRENLRDTHCEENLSFYQDVDDFVRSCRQAIRSVQKHPSSNSMDSIKEIMAQAYGIYNAFLAPGSPCELNIDHQLRNNLATRMTKAVGQDGAIIDSLREVTVLFEDAQNAVFKLMASDSVPKFLRHPKYETTLRNYDFDAIVVDSNRVERSQSHSTRSK